MSEVGQNSFWSAWTRAVGPRSVAGMNESRGMLHRRVGRVGVTAGLAACLSLLSVQGAAAEQSNASDPAGDVVTVKEDAGPNGNDTVSTRHPERAYGDIRHLHANHTYDRVAVSLRYRDLTA